MEKQGKILAGWAGARAEDGTEGGGHVGSLIRPADGERCEEGK